jgi:putative ABC transport system ATP-binding protein
MTHLIHTKDLSKSYFSVGEFETKVLRNIDLIIEPGEFIAIMGPSGSGKSTLMHILGFLDIATRGSYAYKGRPMQEMNDDELARIRATEVSFVFQSFNLLPRTSMLENVMLPLLYHPAIPSAERVKRAEDAIEAVGLSHRKGHSTNQLSGGEQQRTAIARALVTDPEIIFADEPTGNLDSASGKQVMSILQKLHRENHTVILVTHERKTAEHSERIIHILDGKIDSDSKDFKRVIADAIEVLK